MSMNLPIDLDTSRVWTLEDYQEAADDLSVRMDLVEGRLRVVTPAKPIHNRIGRRLANEIESCAPARWQVDTEIGVLLSDDPTKATQVQPDVVVYSAGYELFDPGPVAAKDAVLVVEVVSPSSRRNDRMEFPRLYESAGIKHYWRVETPKTSTDLQIFTYRLSGRTYRPDGDYTEILKVEQPFPMTIDVPALAS